MTKLSATIRVFTARACAAPLQDASRIFEERTGIRVLISQCDRHCAEPKAERATAANASDDFLVEIADAGVHDLAIAGAEYLLDDGEVRGICVAGQRRTIALRRAAILLPAGNPKGVRELVDLARPGVRVAVSVIDCLKGAWEDICARAGLLEEVRRNITFHANGCVSLVETVAEGRVDAAFGWTTFEHLAPGRIEVVPLPPEQSISRGTGVSMLSFAREPEAARRFIDFLVTPEARACYERYGWTAPSGGSG